MVMGMHRSGTSALTGVLGLLGLDLGRSIMPATEDNPRGYFENQRVNRINERLLAALGSSWHDVFPLEEGWWKAEAARPFAGEIRLTLEEEFQESPLFALKDPRMCRLFPLWREALEDMGIEICAVIPVRRPAEVAESLKLRHGFSLEKGLFLWMIHTISAEAFTRGMPRAWLSFEGLLNNPKKTIAGIGRSLSLTFPTAYEDVREEIAAFLEPALKHFNHKKDSRSGITLPRIVGDWHRLLTASCRPDGCDRKTMKAMDGIREEFERLRAFFQPDEIRNRHEFLLAGSASGTQKPFAPVERPAAAVTAPNPPAPNPPLLASESWQWLREYREAASALSLPPNKERKKSFSVSPLTYHARPITGDGLLRPLTRAPEKPRIIHVIGNIRTGGSTRLVVDLYERLGHIYDQEVISLDIPDPLHYDGFPFHDFSEPVSAEELQKFFREKAPHIIHFHFWADPWYEKVMEAAARTGAIIVENVNTPHRIMRHPAVAHYVFVSRHAMDSVAPGPENASIIYPGSDGTMFAPVGAPADDTIGMVYRLDIDKLREDSIQPLIEAVRARPRTKVIIVGGGALLPSYRRQVAEAGLAGRFLFAGYVPYHELPSWYAKFSVFAAPVWNESFGQVVPFAMAMGIPVAGYAVGALPEILGADEKALKETDSGRSQPKSGSTPAIAKTDVPGEMETADCLGRNEGELVDILLRLLDDRDLRHRIGDTLLARFKRLFRVETMIEGYSELYSRLLESGADSVSIRRAGLSL